MSQEPTEPESTIRFLIEQAFKESELLWVRINFMMAIQAAAVAGLLTLLAADFDPHRVLATSLCVLGFVSTLVWLQIVRMSRYYNDTWLRDARCLASRSGLDHIFAHSLGFLERNPENYRLDGNKEFFSLRRPRWPATGASRTIYYLIVAFLITWLLLGIWVYMR